MSIDPRDSTLVHLEYDGTNYHLMSSDKSNLGIVEYKKTSDAPLPESWQKVAVAVDHVITEGFLNFASNPILSAIKAIQELPEPTSQKIVQIIEESAARLPYSERAEMIANLLFLYRNHITSYPPDIAEDFDICMALIQKSPLLLRHFSDRIKNRLYKKPEILITPYFLPILSDPKFIVYLQDQISKFYTPPSPTSELSSALRSLINFCGLNQVIFKGEDLERIHSFDVFKECITLLPTPLKGLPDEDRFDFLKAFNSVLEGDILNEETVEKIQTGEFVLLPIGTRTHSVTILFYKDYFALCDRGGNPQGVIKLFRYDRSKISFEKLIYLMSNYLANNPLDEYAYKRFPALLEAVDLYPETSHTPPPLQIKTQKMNNCTKASAVTALKVGIFLKALDRGMEEKEAARMAKDVGKTISFGLREQVIKSASAALQKAIEEGSISEAEATQASTLIQTASTKLERDRLIASL